MVRRPTCWSRAIVRATTATSCRPSSIRSSRGWTAMGRWPPGRRATRPTGCTRQALAADLAGAGPGAAKVGAVRRGVPLLAVLALLVVPSTASAVDTYAPFGHPCTPQNGVDFCPTANDSQRVPSFDGVPLDVDATFPLTGSPPFPAIVLLHGFPGLKTSFEA